MNDNLNSLEKKIRKSIIQNEEEIKGVKLEINEIHTIERNFYSSIPGNDSLVEFYKKVNNNEINTSKQKAYEDFLNSISIMDDFFIELENFDKFDFVFRFLRENIHLMETLKKFNFYDNFIHTFYNRFSSKFCKSRLFQKIESSLIEIKFPIFEGMIIAPILNELLTQNKPVIIDSLNNILEYLEILIRCEVNSDSSKKIYQNEFFSVFFQKKIYNNFFKILSERKLDKFDLNEFLESIVKYCLKTIDNTNEFLKFIINRSNSNIIFSQNNQDKLFTFIMSNFIYVLSNLFLSNLSMIKNEIIKTESTFNQTFRLIDSLNKQVKIYSYDIHKNKNFTDFFYDHLGEKVFKDIILNQKQFTSKFINENIYQLLSYSESKNFDPSEILDMIYLILKDNFKLCVLSKNKTISNFALENNALFCLKELQKIFRSVYNKELDILNSKSKTIEKKVVFYLIEIIYKFITYFDKFYKKLSHNSQIDIKKTTQIVSEIQKLLDSYSLLVIKDLKINGFDKLINLFTYDNLNKLSEDEIEKIFILIKSNQKNYFNDLNIVKISVEAEEFVVSQLIFNISEKISYELELSLKQNPKNKNFDILIEKTLKIFDEIINKSSMNHKAKQGLNNNLSNLNSLFKNLYLNKI